MACSLMSEEEVDKLTSEIYTQEVRLGRAGNQRRKSQFEDTKMAKDTERWVVNGKGVGSRPSSLQAS